MKPWSRKLYEQIINWFNAGSGVKITDGTNDVDILQINGTFGLATALPGHVCSCNSTTALLDGDEVFTGDAEDTTNHGIIMIAVYASHASATDGLEVQFSPDNVNWYTTDNYTIPATTLKTFSSQCVTKYFRLKYTNGAVAQTEFFIQVALKPTYSKPSSHRIADAISSQDDAELVKAVLTAENALGSFVNINASSSGNLLMTDAENMLAVAKGEVAGASEINKWGNAPDFDETDGEVDIWDGAEDGAAWELMNYVYPSSNTIDSLSSSDAADNMDIVIEGLDVNGAFVTQTKTLNGQNRVALSTNLWRVFRAYNNNGTEFAGHVFVYENDTLTGGVPDTNSKIKLVMHPEEQQTEMALYTIPAGYTGYLLGGYVSTAGANKSSNYIIKFKIRPYGKVFTTKQKVAISDTGTSFLPFLYHVPQKILEKSDIRVTAIMTASGGTGASISAGFSLLLVEN